MRDEVMADDQINQRQKNKVIISKLNDAGLFNLRNSVQIISELLGVSRDAIYLHLRTIKKNQSQNELNSTENGAVEDDFLGYDDFDEVDEK
ncbi:helix-turn-helix domain-containing protein [Anaerobiospirillum succiniciproducens]|uniref:helix-turn-helix domain-containing protein n=1 Tax=Anaerobiospirillum succiniciproducens TaxID=13335 RepID=UPI003F88BC5C